MSRYIDADALIAEMSEKHRSNFHEDLKSYHMWIMWYWKLKEAPTIDIVRCGECKYWTYEESCGFFNNKPTCFDDFCSYGQKGDENVETD